MANIKLIFCDLDGTVFPIGSTQITPRFARAVTKAAEKGCIFIPCTGRVLPTIPQEALALPSCRYVVYSNGSATCDLATGELFNQVLMRPEDTAAALELLRPYRLFTELFVEGRIIISRYCTEHMNDYYVPRHHLTWFAQNPAPGVEDLAEYVLKNRIGVEKINVTQLEGPLREQVMALIDAVPGIRHVSSGASNLEIGDEKSNKGIAMTLLARRLGVPLDQVMALGDNDNDLEMLSAAGVSVAMANGTPDAKAAAQYIAPSCNDEGAAQIIEELVLGEQMAVSSSTHR